MLGIDHGRRPAQGSLITAPGASRGSRRAAVADPAERASDLASAVEFDWEAAERSIQAVRPGMPIIGVSAKTGEGVDRYIGMLDHPRPD